MATFLFDKIVFGPIKSRRLGVSLGVNLLPVNCKVCNFNCVYCECGWTQNDAGKAGQFHPAELVASALKDKLVDLKNTQSPLDVITFAGNGEPTMHPNFHQIIEDTIQIRDEVFPSAKVAVLSNATMIKKERVFKALQKADHNILKLDSAFETTIRLINNPLGHFSLPSLFEGLLQFKSNLIIQTMFISGIVNGQKIDNTTEEELNAWLALLKKLKPKLVMIYTLHRDTPSATLHKISLEKLNFIAVLVNNLGIETSVSG